MTTLDEREQRTLSKRCTKCREVKPLEEFPPRKNRRSGRKSWCHVCHAVRARERRWEKLGIPPEDWPLLHQEVEAQAARRNSAPAGFKRCSRCDEVKPLAEYSPDKSKLGGRKSRCRVCDARRNRERRWEKQGIPPESWPHLHQEADARAARRSSVPGGYKACSRCGEAKPLAEFPAHKGSRDGRDSQCLMCHARRSRERRWEEQGIPPEAWPRLHKEADRQRRMRELAAQHGLKYCADCDMCLGRAFFYHRRSSPDGLSPSCKACTSTRVAAYRRTPAGRAAKKGSNHRRRALERQLPTDGTGPRDWAAHAEEIEDFQCHLCGGDLTADDEIHWDHLDPISTGATGTVLHNMHAAHAACNLARGNRPLEEWFAAVELP